MSKITRSTEKTEKDQYKITNWSDYNQSLINRGSLTIWISDDIASWWYDDGPAQIGGQYVYSDKCIECLLTLKAVFGLAYRQLQGFSQSLLELLQVDILCPSYSQIQRRSSQIEVDFALPKAKGNLYLVADSTGLKVYGEGEWKVRKHGYTKRRTWRKLHLGVDESTGYIYASLLTKNSADDAAQVAELLEQVKEPVEKFSGDGAYDKSSCWDVLKQNGIEGIIPPRKDAVYWMDEANELLDHDRNHILERIDKIGRKEWKQESGYHRRSLSETAMFRYKTIFGPKLYSRIFDNQRVESNIKVRALNIMTAQGMPISVKIA
jgi:IS5 family transposase